MLIELRVKNFRSFKDEQIFTMVANTDTSLEGNTFVNPAFPKYKLLRTAAIYGANASGKTNLIKALNFLEDFVSNSHSRKIDAPVPRQPFLLDRTTPTSPTEFEVTFIHQKVRYRYGFIISSSKVLEEWLFAYPSGREQRWFERNEVDQSGDFKTDDNSWRIGSNLKGENRAIALQTRPNVLFLSKAADSNHKQLSEVYNWFAHCLDSYVKSQELSAQITAQIMEQNDRLRQKALALIHSSDLGISNINIKKELLSLTKDLPEDLPEALRSFLLSEFVQNVKPEAFRINTWHELPNLDAPVPFELAQESMGTNRLFALAGPFFVALEEGKVLVMDELEASLHPLLVRSLVQLFQNEETNPKGAQLIFNTHNTQLLDPDFLRRDQIWLVEKDAESASHLYSLSDFKPRKGEAFERNYLSGRYGATPILSDLALLK